MPPAVKVTGLKEVRRDLRKLQSDAPWRSDLREANKSAAEVVAADARRLAGGSTGNLAGGTARLGSRGIASIRALSSQTSATVAGGGASVPYYGGSDFGSHGGHRQFPSFKPKGRFIYPALEKDYDEVLEVYRDALGRVTRRYFG